MKSRLAHFLSCASAACLVLSAGAFTVSSAGSARDAYTCWMPYEPTQNVAYDPCKHDGSCTDEECKHDSERVGNSSYTWCECGGAQDGVVDNESCHAKARYVGPGAGWVFADFECLLECRDPWWECCRQNGEDDGTGLKKGDRLCECVLCHE